MQTNEQQPWGRVDENGTVYVRDAGGERAVGQYPDGSPDEALAYYERKYTDLAGQVTLLEQRVRRGAPATDVAAAVAALNEALLEPSAVGDIAALRNRAAALETTAEQLSEQQRAESDAALAAALSEREAIVVEVEQLATLDPARAQWKQVTAQVDDLFARWQKHQQDGPRLRRSDSNELWKRFRAARTIIEQHRKQYFTELDAAHKETRQRKQRLVERAEELAPRGVDGIPAYRQLLDEWKAAGRAGKKIDDALWARFKAAGDVLFQAKSESDQRDLAEQTENLTAKEALLEEAAVILTITDRQRARDQLTGVQRRWDEIGRVPRDQMKRIEERLRAIEQHVRRLDEEHWERNNPERKARAEGLASQLENAIAGLEAELESAQASGDAGRVARAQDALDARRSWLEALG